MVEHALPDVSGDQVRHDLCASLFEGMAEYLNLSLSSADY